MGVRWGAHLAIHRHVVALVEEAHCYANSYAREKKEEVVPDGWDIESHRCLENAVRSEVVSSGTFKGLRLAELREIVRC